MTANQSRGVTPNDEGNNGMSKGTYRPPGKKEDILEWKMRIHILQNGLIWRDLLITTGLPFVIIAGIITAISGADDRPVIIFVFAIIFCIILLIMVVILATLSHSLQGGIEVTFFLNAEGVRYESGVAAQTISRGTRAFSLLTGSLGMSATSLIALSQEQNFIAWDDVRRATISPRFRVIYLRGTDPAKPLALYCTPENFLTVIAFINRHAPQTGLRG